MLEQKMLEQLKQLLESGQAGIVTNNFFVKHDGKMYVIRDRDDKIVKETPSLDDAVALLVDAVQPVRTYRITGELGITLGYREYEYVDVDIVVSAKSPSEAMEIAAQETTEEDDTFWVDGYPHVEIVE